MTLCSSEEVGQDAFLAAAAGFAPTPGPAGEVADFAFHDRPILSAIGLPVRIALAGLGVLECGFMGMDCDHSTAADFGAFG